MTKFVMLIFFDFYEGYFMGFASLICSLQRINKWAANQRNLILHIDLFFDIIIIPSETFFISIDKFVLIPVAYHARSFFSMVYHLEVCCLYSFVQPRILVPIGSPLILWLHSAPYTKHILVRISLPKTYFSVKHFIAHPWVQLPVSPLSLFFSSPCNF